MPIKKILIAVFFTFGTLPALFATPPAGDFFIDEVPATDTALFVRQVRAEFERINKANPSARTFKWEYDSTCSDQYQSGKVTLYTLNGDVVKVHSEGYAEHGSWKEDFYFRSDTLFFMYQNNAYGGAQNPEEFNYQNRYYMQDNKLIKAIETGEANDTDYVQRLSGTAYALRNAKSAAEVAKILSCGE